MERHAFFVGGRATTWSGAIEIVTPFDGAPFATVGRARAPDVDAALDAAVRGTAALRAVPAWRRAEILHAVALRLLADRERFARTIALEAGKPITQARVEVERAALTFRT